MVTVRSSKTAIFFLISLFIGLVGSSSAFATTNLYMSKSGAGSGNGQTSCANAFAWSYFNSTGNWSNTPSGSQIGPGVVVHHCAETDTSAAGGTALTFQCGTANGTSNNPITLVFDQGATVFQSTYWSPSGGAINNSGSCSYVVINGGNNLTIQNTANGTQLANQQNSYGINLGNCTYCTVENTTVKNIYVNNGSSPSASDTNGQNTACIALNGTSTGSTITSNTVSQCKIGISVSADPNGDASNVTVSNNSTSDMDWGINVGGGDSGDTINNIVISGNSITNWTNWQFPTNAYHQDGIILFNSASNAGDGAATLTARVYNNNVYGDLGVGSPTGFLFCSWNSQCTVYNNLFVNTGHVIYGIVWLDTHMGGYRVYNNTIVGLSGDFAITLGTSVSTNFNAAAVFNNNIVVGPGIGIHDYSTLMSDVGTSDRNVWRTAGGTAPQMASGDSTDVSYATWLGSGFDKDSTNSDPKLDGSYHLQSGSSATGLAANLTTLNINPLDFDMARNPRPPQTVVYWDAGVFNASSGTAAPAPPTGLTASVH